MRRCETRCHSDHLALSLLCLHTLLHTACESVNVLFTFNWGVGGGGGGGGEFTKGHFKKT